MINTIMRIKKNIVMDSFGDMHYLLLSRFFSLHTILYMNGNLKKVCVAKGKMGSGCQFQYSRKR